MDDTARQRQWITCPGCDEAFDPEAEPQALQTVADDGRAQCPYCSTRFPAPVAETAGATAPPPPPTGETFHVEDDAEPADEPEANAPDDRAINRNKVRQLSALRRGLYRTRSYVVTTAVALLVVTVQLAIMTVGHVRLKGWGARPAGYACAAAAAALGAGLFVRKTGEINRELRTPTLAEPDTPPDFSTLSDGSDYWRRLEDLG